MTQKIHQITFDESLAAQALNNRILFLIVGRSGVGKTTIADELYLRYGLRQVNSATTRPRRHPDETGHRFCSESEMPPKSKMIGYTFFDGNHYWATNKDLKGKDLYIVDPDGIEYFRKKYKGSKPYYIIEIAAERQDVEERLKKRKDVSKDTRKRLLYDNTVFIDLDSDVIIYNKTGKLDECVDTVYKYIVDKNKELTGEI